MSLACLKAARETRTANLIQRQELQWMATEMYSWPIPVTVGSKNSLQPGRFSPPSEVKAVATGNCLRRTGSPLTGPAISTSQKLAIIVCRNYRATGRSSPSGKARTLDFTDRAGYAFAQVS